jgi:hypothetical protein
MNVQFDAKTEAVIEKVRKLLALANNNPNEQEAEAAAAKAQELLEAYNLDLAHVSRMSGNGHTPRDKQNLKGGLYGWQRQLWNMTAELNFCKYWYKRGLRAGSSYEHELLGSKVNVISTRLMAEYLQNAIERLAREWMRDNRPGLSIFTKEAIAYREGMAERVVSRMWELRRQRIADEEAKAKAERAANAARGVFTENALTITDVISSEEDLNSDHIYGWEPGTSARRRKESAIRQEAAEREAAELLRKQNEWDAAHPEEAAARKAKEKAEYEARTKEWWAKQGKRRERKMTPEEERRQMGSFRQGYNKGAEISLDKQIDEDKRRLT